jgi:putative endonuclease
VTGARAKGARAEDAVVDFLTTRGFAILGRNVRLGALEIDVVARKGALAAIVEVRTRGEGSYVGPLESVSARKRATLVRAAERLWREKLSKLDGVERLRLDVAAVTFDGPRAHVEYVEGAFTA